MTKILSRLGRMLPLAFALTALTADPALAAPALIGAPGSITGISGVHVGGTSYTASFYANTSYSAAAASAGGAFLFDRSFAQAATEALYQLFSGAGVFQGSALDLASGQLQGEAPGDSVAYFTPYGVWVYTDWNTMENTVYVLLESFVNGYGNYEGYDTTDARSGSDSMVAMDGACSNCVFVNWSEETSLPEPSGLALMMAGLGLLPWRRRVSPSQIEPHGVR